MTEGAADGVAGDGGDRQLVLVIGVGRSGTSAFTGILRELGYHVPQPEVQADETNPRGFGEPRWVVDFHTRLLRQCRVTTIDSRPAAWAKTAELSAREEVLAELRSWLEVQFVGTPRVVVKDPRISWFLPLWQRCATDVGVPTAFTTMLRPPTEVLGSARQWYGSWQNDASRAAGWVNIMLRVEQQSRSASRAVVRYDRLLADWSGQLARVGTLLTQPGLQQVDGAQRDAVDAFIDPQLRRQSRGWDDLAVPLAMRDLVDRTWQALLPLAEDQPPSAAAALDELAADFDRYYAETEAVAQSSIRAAKPRKKPATTTSPSAEKKAAAAPKKAATAESKRSAPPPSLARRVRRRLRRITR